MISWSKGLAMSQLPQDPSLLDIFKERLSNPFLFTYFWVFCSLNWKTIFWLLLEPVNISKKLFLLESQHPWDWWTPIWVSAILVALLPWVNSAVEVLKRFAENRTNVLLSKFNWKEMVKPDVHEEILTKKQSLELANDTLEARVDRLSGENNEYINSIKQLEQMRSESDSKIKSLRKELTLESERVKELQDKYDHYFAAYNHSGEEVAKLNSQLIDKEDLLHELHRKIQNTPVITSRLLNDAIRLKKRLEKTDFDMFLKMVHQIEIVYNIHSENIDSQDKYLLERLMKESEKLNFFMNSHTILNNLINLSTETKQKLTGD